MTGTYDPTDTDDPTGPEDPAGAALSAAGRRLRQQQFDEVAARQALARVQHHADAPPPPERRSLWPALIGAGLAAAAVVGVIAIRADDTDTLTPATSPEQTIEVESEPTHPRSTLGPWATCAHAAKRSAASSASDGARRDQSERIAMARSSTNS